MCLLVVLEILFLFNSTWLAKNYVALRFKMDISRVSRQLKNKNLPEQEKAIKYIELGKILFKQKKPEDALRTFTQAVQADPQNFYAYKYRGITNTTLKKYPEAIADLQQYIAAANNADEKLTAYYHLIWAYTTMQKYDDALKVCTNLIKMHPSNAELYRRRASVYGKKRDFKSAIENTDIAIKMNPSNPRFYYAKGYFYHRENNLEEAVKNYTEAIKLDPKWLSYYYNRGTAYYRLGKDDEALNDFFHMIKIAPRTSILRMRVLYKIAAIGITDLTGWRMGTRHGTHPPRTGQRPRRARPRKYQLEDDEVYQ